MASVAAINNLSGHAHNPRGNLWFNDDSTYGHKLLMKMGWNKGKGLGKNEDGIKENIKVKFRNTNSGLGFKNDAYANVMKTEYESILKNLAAEYSNSGTTNPNKDADNSKESMHKSKVVKSKLRYPKLFFGKDVTKYSEKDMKSIFICSTPLKSIEGESENGITTDTKNLESEPPKTSTTYSSSLSVSDYFAKKMEEKRKSSLNKCSSNALSDYENKISKRTQKVSQGDIEKGFSDIEELNKVTIDVEGAKTENLAVSNKKSRKRKKKFEDNIEEEINSNEIEPYASNIKSQQVPENSVCKNRCEIENKTDQSFSSKLSKKRKMSLTFENDSVEYSENAFPSEMETSLLSTKKKKKKSKKKSAEVELCSENSVSANNATEIHKETNSNLSLEPSEDGMSNDKNSPKKKKKAKKKLKEKLRSCLKNKCGSYSLKNVSFNETVSYRIIDSEFESVDPLASEENVEENTIFSDFTYNNQSNCSSDTCSEEKSTSSESFLVDSICTEEQDKVSGESDVEYKLSFLPSPKSPYYNSWIEDQRQALKMQLYKDMLKNIKNHEILKTSNLLSIKGYGNWGYK